MARQAVGGAIVNRIIVPLDGYSFSKRALEWKADLIVMATHGRGGFSRLWLGSVADALRRQVSVPILLVKPDGAPREATDRPWVPRRMLVALDGSAFAEQILEPAGALARLMEAELVLVQVMEAPLLAEHGAELHYWLLGDEPERRYREDPVAEARLFELHRQVQQRAAEVHRYLERVGAEHTPDLGVETAVVDHARVARGILEQAEASGCDLIALATHGQTGLARFVRDSVADKVIRGADVPLLVVRPAGEDRP